MKASEKYGLGDLKKLRKQHQQLAAETARQAPKAATPKGRTDPAALSDEDRRMFRQAVKAVQPIKAGQRVLLPPRPQATANQLRERRALAMGREVPPPLPVSDHYAPAHTQHDAGSHVQSGYGRDLIKGLQKGKWRIEASLDLHGCTLDEARRRLDQFLDSCITHDIKCVRIVHGKGHGSRDGEAVLKQTVRRWLTQMQCVKAYTECSEADGGAGAVQVLLRLGEIAA